MSKECSLIISAFPGCGKSYLYNKIKESYPNSIIDSDSSNFSWIKDEKGNNTKKRNPDFPNNYINHIKEHIGKTNIILVSSHDVVRKALKDAGLKFILVYPDKDMKEEFIRRYKERGDSENFINFIESNWVKFIDEMYDEDDELCYTSTVNEQYPYLDIRFIKAIEPFIKDMIIGGED
jgi:hypothetical protein